MIELKDVLPYIYATIAIVLLWWRSRVERARNTAKIEANAQLMIQEQVKEQKREIVDLQNRLDKTELALADSNTKNAKLEGQVTTLTQQLSQQTLQLDEYKHEREKLSTELAKKTERENALSEELNTARSQIREQGTRLSQMEGAAQAYRELLALAFKPAPITPNPMPAN